MKNILKILVFTFISLYITQAIIGGFVFGGNYNLTFLLVLVALSLIYLFLGPLLNVLSLPFKGPGGIFFAFVLTVVVLFMLTVLLPSFAIQETTVAELNILGFVLPSKSLTKMWSLVFSALLLVIILHFFKWISGSKKK